MTSSRFRIFFTLFFIYFLDIGGIGIAFVVFSPMIISPDSPFVSSASDLATRNMLLGILFSVYPLAQFFGAPVLGALSDRIGRKSILMVANLITALSFWLTAFSISFPNLFLLFFSRLIGGLAAGNATVAQATASDLVDSKKRPQYMAGFAMIGGLSWIVCPVLGSLLSESKLVSWFSYSLPFTVMGMGFFLAFILLFFWKEQVRKKTEKKFSLFSLFEGFGPVISSPRVFTPFVLSLLMLFVWLMYQGFIAPYVIGKFQLSQVSVGILFTYFSTCWFLGGLLANQWLVKKFSPEKVNLFPLIISGISILALVLFPQISSVWISSPFSNMATALSLSCFFGIFSHSVSTHNQGKLFGFWNAGCALASALAPLLSGWLSRYFLELPFLVSALLFFVISYAYIRWYRFMH
jgi:DHA1 family tetracycline resistance protein-like MFS transporter